MANTANLDEIVQVIEPVINEAGYSLVEAVWGTPFRRRTLTVYIDKPGGALLDDCHRLSRQLGDMLEEQEMVSGNYVLEVSSPGAERPLKRVEDYRYFQGRYALIRTKEHLPGMKTSDLYGHLRGLEDGQVVLELEDGQTIHIQLDEIAKARLAIKF